MEQIIVKTSYTPAVKQASKLIAEHCANLKPTKQAKEHFKRKPFYMEYKK